jgi:hypothetical protein
MDGTLIKTTACLEIVLIHNPECRIASSLYHGTYPSKGHSFHTAEVERGSAHLLQLIARVFI